MDTPYFWIISILILAYVCLVHSFRWRRYNEIHKKYHKQFETQTMTPEEAQQVLHLAVLYDMPTLMKYSLAFSLFKAAAVVRARLFSQRATSHLEIPFVWKACYL